MTQPALLTPVRPPVRPLIDLRCCDVVEMLESLDEPADLVVADPPWSYVQKIGATRADNHYDCLTTPQIVAHVERAVGYRLALWITSPLLGAWPAELGGWGKVITAGTWVKSGAEDSGHYGQGYHWAGCTELVLLYTHQPPHTDRGVACRSAWVEPPQAHSRKPVEWQAQWIRRWVPPGGLVVDLYAGLGSVAEAVLLAGGGRRYIGAEIDPDRHAAALGLIAQVRGMPRVYVASRAIAWRAVDLRAWADGLGFLPVFASVADAMRELPDCAVYAIEVPDSWVAVARPRTTKAGEAR